jgi:hypothetical protein
MKKKEKAIAKKKEPKLSLIELKRRLSVGSEIVLIDFHGEEVNKKRTIAYVSSSFVKMTGDGIKEGDFEYLTLPKASKLKYVEGGFIINGKYGESKYSWQEEDSSKGSSGL